MGANVDEAKSNGAVSPRSPRPSSNTTTRPATCPPKKRTDQQMKPYVKVSIPLELFRMPECAYWFRISED